MGAYRKINGEMIPVTTEGHPQYYFDTLAQAEAALSQLPEGADVFVEEGSNARLTDMLHPIGTIIESTICDTMAKVVATYGGKTWIQHSGYVLRGATSGVTSNDATKTGGNDTHTLTVNEMPSHTHTQNAHNHGIGVAGNTGGVANNVWAATNATGYTNSWGDPTDGSHVYGRVSQNGNRAGVVSSTTAVNNNTGGGQAFSVLENYKSVYIWERTA